MAWVLDNRWTQGVNRCAMSDEEAVEWLATAVGAPPEQLARDLGLHQHKGGAAGGLPTDSRPLALELAVLLHRVVATLRRAQREPRASRAIPRINMKMPPHSQPLLGKLSARFHR